MLATARVRRVAAARHWKFSLSMRHFLNVGHPKHLSARVTEPAAVRRLFAALGLAAQPPPARPVTAS
jgi:hypothetical protein